MRDAGGTDKHISAHCRMRVPVKLRAELPGRAGRVGGVAVPATPRSARQVEAAGALIRRGPRGPLQPRPASRQQDAILIVIVLAAAANLALLQGLPS